MVFANYCCFNYFLFFRAGWVTELPPTLVLPIVRLDGITISSGNSIGLLFGLDE